MVRRALAMSQAALGPDHPDVAQALAVLAALLYDTGRLTEAEPMIRQALAICGVVSGTGACTGAAEMITSGAGATGGCDVLQPSMNIATGNGSSGNDLRLMAFAPCIGRRRGPALRSLVLQS